METPVDRHLARRMNRISDPTTRGFLPSFLLHASIVGFLVLGPLLSPKRAEPIEIRPIQIVPLQALGVPNPPAETRRSAPPAPQPEPPAAKPEPEKKATEPEPDDSMVLPEKKKPRKKPVDKPVERKRAPERSTAPSDRSTTRDAPSQPAQRRGSARGNVAGTSAFGGAVGVDDPDFTYGYYVDQMLALISAQWYRPDVGSDIEAELHFRVHRSGNTSDLEIRTSSGSSTFDLAAMRAVTNASPLPPLPGGYPHDSLGVNLLFR